MGGRDQIKEQETLGAAEYVHHLDCGEGFLSVHMSNHQVVHLMCSLSHQNKVAKFYQRN